MVFPLVMYGYESWAIKKVEHWRIDAFELWCWRKLRESLGLQDQTSQSWRKSVLNIHWKDWYWSWNSSTLATWCEELTHWKRPWCWKNWRQEKEMTGCDGWMASPTLWTWVWASSGSFWWTGKPGVLQSQSLTWLSNWTKLPCSTWVGALVLLKNSKILLCIFIVKNQNLPQGYTIDSWLLHLSFCIISLSWLALNLFESAL